MSTSSSDSTLCIALIAHDAKKPDLVAWAGRHHACLAGARVFATGTTGTVLSEAWPALDITCLKSGPLGGDQQIGAMICEGRLNALVFFIDPLAPMPHDVDVKALNRLAVVYDVPLANWIWGGAILMAIGGVFSLADRRYRVAAGARKAALSDGLPAE